MTDIPTSLRLYVENEIIPCYKHFDKAHQTEHVRQVIAESLKLASHYEVNISMVYTIAACHDIGLSEGREFHHIVSAQWMKAEKKLRKWFTEKQIQLMADAVEDHRASNSWAPRSVYGRIIAEADRLIEPVEILRRVIQYGLSHYPILDKEQHYQRYCEHLQEKYAEGGYLKLWIPESDNVLKLGELRAIINDEILKRNYFERIFKEEISRDE